VELRFGNKRSVLSDLRESGAIEQDADLVLFIHRPEKYGIDQDDEGNSLRGIAEIIVAKHRNGAIGDVQLRFRDEFAKFSDLEEVEPIFDDSEGNMTVSSKMNREDTGGNEDNFDLGSNTGFDDQPF
jgi:replicative DNA helicase